MANEFGNYCTWNPLHPPSSNTLTLAAITNGNRTVTCSNGQGAIGTIGVSSGKWYYEIKFDTDNTTYAAFGFELVNRYGITSISHSQDYGSFYAGLNVIHEEGNARFGTEDRGDFDAYAAGDVIGFAVDFDNNAVWYSKNGTWANSATESEIEAGDDTNSIWTGIAGTTITPNAHSAGGSGTMVATLNTGQTAYNTAAPDGFLSINTANLPTPAAKNFEKEYFCKVGIVHTNGATTAVTLPKTVSGGAMVRIKETDATTDWIMFDTVRGVNKALVWNEPDVQDTSTYDDQNLTGTTFTMPSDLPSGTYLLECFYVGSFFQITAFTGNDTARAISFAATLDSVPGFMYIKNLNTASRDGVIYHESLGNTHYIISNDATAQADDATYFNDTTPTATQFTVGTVNETNENTKLMICYAWANSGPYTFGAYTANANANGEFVNLGGPAQVIVSKPFATGDSYLAMYNPLLGYNPNGVRQYWEEPYANSTSTSDGMLDHLANGVKFRTAGTGNNSKNTNYVNYLYFAFGVQPLTDGAVNQGRAGAVKPFGQAYGGTISVFNNSFVHVFTASGTFTPTISGSVDFLVIAGGGAGSSQYGGGGGAGGYRNSFSSETSGGGGSSETALSLTAGTTYTVTVGAGGTGASGQDGNNGANSVFATITSIGGGGGGQIGNDGKAGGSGGGGGGDDRAGATFGTGTANQGFNGGAGDYDSNANNGGGGGGSGAVGVDGDATDAGSGGNGLASSITGASVTRAGGGGGGAYATGGGVAGAAGSGNAGAGANANSSTAGSATANTGSGGGGAGSGGTSGAGGSGIVIVRYTP